MVNPAPTAAATLHLSPATGAFGTQNSFTVSVVVSSNQSVNGVEGEVQFPTNKIEVIGITKRDSIFSLWVQEPSFSNLGPTGRINFSGVKLNPGFLGNNGKILDITFRVKDTGIADVVFGSGAVLANDGRGTNIISSFGSGVYMLREGSLGASVTPPTTAPQVYRPTDPLVRPVIRHFVQDRYGSDVLLRTSDDTPGWTNSLYAKFTWSLPANATGVVMLIDDKPDTDPGKNDEGLIDNRVFPRLQEGKQYLHIRFVNAGGPGPILHYPLFIDVNPPKNFTIEFAGSAQGAGGLYATSNPRPFVSFYTDDTLSGVERYEIKVGDNEWLRAEELAHDAPYPLPKQLPNKRAHVVVRAFDRAGNYADALSQMVVEPVVQPIITYLPSKITVPRETFIVEGSAAPQAEVTVLIGNETPKVFTTKADDNGNWRLITHEPWLSGMYAVSAKQIISNGAESLYTDPIYVRVRAAGSSWWWNVLEWLERGNGYILLIILIAMQVGMFAYYRYRLRELTKKDPQKSS